MDKVIDELIESHIETIKRIKGFSDIIREVASLFINALRQGNKAIFFGNGGSAADAQHLSAELVGRFHKKRAPLPAVALNTNTSIITAVGNDFGFDNIFSYQTEAIENRGDIVIGISTSGNSNNVIKGILKAKEKNITTIGLLGKDGGKLKEYTDIAIVVPSNDTARVQEAHILVGHIICEIVENELFE